MAKYKMTPKEIEDCRGLYGRLAELNMGNPDDGGEWFTFHKHKDWQDRLCAHYWETLMGYLARAGFPHDLKHAVKYVMLSPYEASEIWITSILDWLRKNPEYI